MVSSFLSKLKDVKGSYLHRKTHNCPPLEENPSALAKTRSLQRASIRAKTSRAQGSDNSEIGPHNGLGAFNVLTGLQGEEEIVGGFDSNEYEKANCKAARADAVVTKVAASLIQGRIDRDLDLWDREFSSMSSYGSDRDALSGKPMRLGTGNAAVVKSIPIEERDCAAAGGSDHEPDDFALVLDTASSCSEGSSNESVVSCKCGCKNNQWLESNSRPAMPPPVAQLDSSSYRKKDTSAYRKKRSNSSISAALPSDLRGIVSDSIALVKISHNPYEDFRESMYEMITEKDLEESLDMEELLYSYLSLNSPEHHQLIEEVFSDVWSAILLRLR